MNPLYRIYDKVNKKYVSSYKYMISINGLIYLVNNTYPETLELNQDDYIVEKCTGLKDKNKQWIYEGDRLKTYQILASDTIDSKSFIVAVERVGGYFISNGSLNSYQADISEIIGTIHE